MTSDASAVPTPDEAWVQDQLRSLPPVQMPEDVAARINAALQAEVASRTSGSGGSSGSGGIGGSAGSSDTGADAPGSAEPIDINRRRGLFTGLAVAASVAMALMLLAWTPWQTQPDAYEQVVALTTVQPVSTDTNYTAANIEQAVSTNLNNVLARGSELPAATESQRRGSFAANDEVMASCLDGLGTAPSQVRLVDLAEYQGQPSGIVVFSDGDGNLVVVVAPRCGREDPGVRMRLTTTAANTQP